MENSIKLEMIKILGVLSLLEKEGSKVQNDLINVARESVIKVLNITDKNSKNNKN